MAFSMDSSESDPRHSSKLWMSIDSSAMRSFDLDLLLLRVDCCFHTISLAVS